MKASPCEGTLKVGRGPLLRQPGAASSSWKRLLRPTGSRDSPMLVQPQAPIQQIELNLQDIHQLFNTMDPSPFHEKDLDHDAEEFILSWAQEFHRHDPVHLIVHLETFPEQQNAQQVVECAIHNYFAYRARLNQMELKRLMRLGRASLLVGLFFLLICLGISELFTFQPVGALQRFLSEGLTIAGWVAMWKPMQIYLYDWWPLRRRGQVFQKLSRMPIQ